MGSAEAVEDCRLSFLPGSVNQTLAGPFRNFALCLIDGLVAKGKCYSTLSQILGTRLAIERLACLLLNLGELHGEAVGQRIVIRRTITHAQLASIIGTTRQWVTVMLNRFRKKGILSITPDAIVIERPSLLNAIITESAADAFVVHARVRNGSVLQSNDDDTVRRLK